MTKIIKIHGCSGAGKTTAVRELMKLSEQVDKLEEADSRGKYRTLGHSAYFPELTGITTVFFPGSYDNNCGGVDTMSSADEVMAMVIAMSISGHVVYEGLLQSTYYGKMGKWSQQFGDNFIYAFLDTPIYICLDRVVARRHANGSTNKFDPQLTRDKHKSILNLRDKLQKGVLEQSPGKNHVVVDLRYDQPLAPQLLDLLK